LLDTLRRIERRGRYETARRARSLAERVFKYAIATNRAERDPSVDLAGDLISPHVQHRAAIVEPKASARCCAPSTTWMDSQQRRPRCS
jgi:hypothetical protein